MSVATPSLRQMWLLYKRVAQSHGAGRRELLIAHEAFYGGVRGALLVMAHLIEHGEFDQLHALIKRQGRQIDRIRRARPPRRH